MSSGASQSSPVAHSTSGYLPAAFGQPTDHFQFDRGVLTVRGTGGNDLIRLWETADSLLRASITTGNEQLTFRVESSEVDKMEVFSLNGHDDVRNRTGIESRLVGGNGNDRLLGGSYLDTMFGGSGADWLSGDAGADILRGGDGNDQLFGGDGADRVFGEAGGDLVRGQNGDDRIYGGAGNDELRADAGNDQVRGEGGSDRLFGDAGNDLVIGGGGNDLIWGGNDRDRLRGDGGKDELRGGAGDDILEGNEGNDYLWGDNGQDRLIGGNGSDWLRGGNDDDGLIPGAGYDQLRGQGGSDRILRSDFADTIYDLQSNDAIVQFYAAAAQSVDFTGTQVQFAAGTFGDDELVWVDEAFALMQRVSGSTQLLRQSDGGLLRFYRHGEVVNGPGGILGWNRNGVEIHLTEYSFSDQDLLVQTVIHEAGHNWDEAHENDTIDHFRSLSQWVWNGLSWSYRPGKVNFVRRYGTVNPYEDFATSFAAYFMQFSNYIYQGIPVSSRGVGANAARDKMDYMEYFLESL